MFGTGDHLDFEIVVLKEQADASMDWFGIYPSGVRTLPGTAQGRYRYFNSPIGNAVGATENKDHPGCRVIRVRLEPHELPNHAGLFEIRIHLNNYYGTPDVKAAFYIAEAHIQLYRMWLFLAFVVDSSPSSTTSKSCSTPRALATSQTQTRRT